MRQGVPPPRRHLSLRAAVAVVPSLGTCQDAVLDQALLDGQKRRRLVRDPRRSVRRVARLLLRHGLLVAATGGRGDGEQVGLSRPKEALDQVHVSGKHVEVFRVQPRQVCSVFSVRKVKVKLFYNAVSGHQDCSFVVRK